MCDCGICKTVAGGVNPWQHCSYEMQETGMAHTAARRERVAAARRDGKSIRAIATKEGISRAQVERDLLKSGRPEPAKGRIEGMDGKTYPATYG